VLTSASNEELDKHPLDYRPVSQPADEPLRYYGVIREATIEHQGQGVSIQILLVKSRTKAKLDRDQRQTYLKRLTDRLEEIQGMLNKRRYRRKSFARKRIDKALRGISSSEYRRILPSKWTISPVASLTMNAQIGIHICYRLELNVCHEVLRPQGYVPLSSSPNRIPSLICQ
jgi:hypothetical protein